MQLELIQNGEEMNMEYAEIFKLDGMLTAAGIQHELTNRPGWGWQITYAADGKWELRKPGCGDAVINSMSYGHDNGLIEVMGFDITDEEYGDEVVGWLRAEEAFRFFKRQYEKDQKIQNGEENESTDH